MTNQIKILLYTFTIFGFLSCSASNNDAKDVGGDITNDVGKSDDASVKCFGPGSFEECGIRDPECIFTKGTELIVDKANDCSEGKKEDYCVLWGEPTANSSSNVFYRENDSGFEYLRISPYVPILEESTWIPCEADLSSSPAPGCNACEDDRP